MNKDQVRELARYLATILSGVSVVGFGLGLYQQNWPCFAIVNRHLFLTHLLQNKLAQRLFGGRLDEHVYSGNTRDVGHWSIWFLYNAQTALIG